MATQTSMIHVRVDDDLKAQATKALADMRPTTPHEEVMHPSRR